MIINIIIIGSLFLDGYLSFFLPMNNFSLFMPLCTLVSLVISFPFVKRKYLLAFFIGCLYDLMYTNMLVLTGCLFITIYYLLSKINSTTKIEILDNLIKLILMIIIYRIIFYFFICILFVKEVNLFTLVNNIIFSFFFNIIYGLILSFILKNKSKQLKYN